MIIKLECLLAISGKSLFVKSLGQLSPKDFSLSMPKHGNKNVYAQCKCNVKSRAIIRDGDRKSWDPRGPMIWDNFSIFRTNFSILTSYIRADPRTCLGLSRGC